MKIIAILLIALASINSFSQNDSNYKFGKITSEEINLKKYTLDTTANAVVLFESGNSEFKVHRQNIIITTKYRYKIKLFNKEGFKHATFNIPLFKSEKVTDIGAITHNSSNNSILTKAQIFEVLIDNPDNITKHYINPFFGKRFSENPFKQENRLYPVDFGFPRQHILNFAIEIPNNYTFKALPKSKNYTLNDNGGRFYYSIKKDNDNRVTLYSAIKIDKSLFYNYEYESFQSYYQLTKNTYST